MKRPLKIFLIEDDADDIELLEELLKENKVEFVLEVIREGDKVSSYLKSCIDLPDVIVMDLNLPKVHGKEILKEIKSTVNFRNIPLVVFTTSTTRDDIDYSYRMGADSYLTKPTSIQGFNAAIATIVKLATNHKVS